jgi:hypothetical protein
METLTDLILQLNFTAREGGELLRADAARGSQGSTVAMDTFGC